MNLSVHRFVLGPLGNNCYLLIDQSEKQAVVIDPSFNSEEVLRFLEENELTVKGIWITHGHFDHFIGVPTLFDSLSYKPPLVLHYDDLDLWEEGGEGSVIGLKVEEMPQPTRLVEGGDSLHLGAHKIDIKHTPGHSPGHVTYYSPELQTAFCGDLIFHNSVGRTDLTGGSLPALMHSIRTQILTLPPETRLLSGHGEPTTVGEEAAHNPFLT